jgi:CRP-like cAMP-binding protein
VRRATVKALTDGEVLVFGKRDMLNMARQSPLELFMIVDSLSNKIERTNEMYCDTVLELDSEKKRAARELTVLNEKISCLEDENRRLAEEVRKLKSSQGNSPR